MRCSWFNREAFTDIRCWCYLVCSQAFPQSLSQRFDVKRDKGLDPVSVSVMRTILPPNAGEQPI